MKFYHGISVTPGIAIGLVSIVTNDALDVTKKGIVRPSVRAEFSRLELAFKGAFDSLAASCKEVTSQLGRQFGQIFEAHSLILSDPKTLEKIKKIIETELVCAEYAVASVFEDNAKKIRALKNPIYAERASDIIDVRDRVLRYLNDVDETEEDIDDNRQYVVVGAAINPTRAAKLSPERTAAIVTETGGLGSHTAIVAAALGVPTVLGVGPFISESNLLNRQSLVIVDGAEGLLITDPDLETVQRYEEKQKVLQERQRRLETFRKTGKAVSLDGVEVEIKGNIEFPHEAEMCVKNGACGVGLYRTEFLYLTAPKGTLPDEEAHFEAYKTVLETVGKEYPTVIRTFDLGADKDPGFENIHEDNPFMGLRSIRLSLRHTPMFRTQLRAILRASVYGKAKVMFPLVPTISEWLSAKAIFKEVCDDLAEEGIPFD
ncbi:MAG: phosphoenolpyruvate--protein phosphotransferase, partial [Thermoguttaceae bacterium]